MRYLILTPALLLVVACGRTETPADTAPAENGVAPSSPATEAPLNPPAPGEVGGLPDDGTPVDEAPPEPGGAQEAASVVERYFGLIEAGRYGEAWRLWSDGGRSSGMDEQTFAAGFARYGEYHANVGAPGRIEGAAGSLYVEVPVQIYGRLAGGQAFAQRGSVTLRRANRIPGATAEQLQWRIAAIDVRPVASE